ncbi:ABC transporter substrate-binding protein [Desulfospira joergensenii]|uniref:ABC transporter substrate-binding protein n=1 Tax=Desulfospira joergensenii TaxID=53329 RepID=UPI0012946D01|nr:ABC transporter substrate-binding protein [Desulfospira joergensenii]
MRFLTIFLVLAWAWGQNPAISSDLPSKNRPKIAMITWRGETRAEEGFADGLRGDGYEPRFVKFHCSQDLDRLDQALKALEKEKPDLIYVFGTTATKQVVQKITVCPIVFNIVTRPVESGIIANWQSSGNNATGVSSMVPIRHQIKTFEKVVSFSRLGIIYNPLEQNSVIQTKILREIARSQGFELIEFKITGKKEVSRVLNNLKDLVDAVYLPSDSMVKILGKQIMAHVNAHKIPSLAAMEEMVLTDSSMMGLVPDYYRLGRLAARKAHAVFRGNHPSTIPAVTSDHFNITVNLKTAQNIGIHIPTAVLVMADKIIR